MNFRILSVLGIMALAVAAWFYYQEDSEIKPALPEVTATNNYEVTGIQAVQTNPETGETEYTLTADSLVQNAQGEDEMVGATINWQPPQGENYTLTAERATFDQQTGALNLKNGFKMVRAATADKPEMVIVGNSLAGNTRDRKLNSQESLTVTQGTDSFKAQGYTADLNTGDYEFHKIDVLFNAPKRQDKPLF
ncbi:LPS export ABC transporter periplasmic protein LptC [Moraxella sp. FZLJ2107]|uniref:LPS export ABC transporter periplasmic protein LptC n=1 Tax=unclassified Moraxella TaxID=2685852 RepID=UPI0020C92D3F|nr:MULTISPECIES: LPS export ABC transporter periplasmic protein LptC [unclassified Moraxella]UTO05518.1 LPS export ABC transporter periplasmic protein LptC [Moraxella sp. FZLJ2107]UTO22254.1 LPS export ABC transporter periplasmic protein LptC [Moraxella sp. FZLJ2109]